MVRRKKHEIKKQGKWTTESMAKAIEAVTSKAMSLRKAARTMGVLKSTLERRVNRKINANAPASRPPVLDKEEESQIEEYIVEMANRGFGLTIKDICEVAYEVTKYYNKHERFNTEKAAAGYDWYQGFMSRHPHLSLRKPEGLSAARATMLNKNVVTAYFNLLSETLNKLKITDKGAQIYNVDETGISTVHVPSKIVGQKGKRVVHSKTSADRGENVTAVVCTSASGHYIPPMIIFKGQRLNKGLISNAPVDTLFATSKSSFIDRELFSSWFSDHFIKHLPAARPVLLILDGHSSHIGISTLKLANENNISILCLPPHTTSELQPLDKCLFKPLKTEYNRSCMDFLKKNPGQLITRYEFCGLFKKAYYKVCNMVNSSSAFRSTGICPLNPNVISPEIFSPSTTSVLETEVTAINQNSQNSTENSQDRVVASTSKDSITLSSPVEVTTDKTLTNILNIPTVVKQASENRKSRKVTSARCLTEHSFIEILEEKENEEEQKRIMKEKRRKELEEKKLMKEQQAKLKKGKGKKLQRKNTSNISSSRTGAANDPENYCAYCQGYYFDDESDDEDWVKCSDACCHSWFHESCTGSFGRLSTFKCAKHSGQ